MDNVLDNKLDFSNNPLKEKLIHNNYIIISKINYFEIVKSFCLEILHFKIEFLHS